MSPLAQFSHWLEKTSVSQELQTREWIVPTVQTVHIIAIALVMSAVTMLALRALGLAAREQTPREVASRFLPVLWWFLPVLLLSGAVLITAEPGRSLQNPVFLLKMCLLIFGILLAVLYRWSLRDAARTSSIRGTLTQAGAVLALLVWIAIVFAGRWIAYVPVA